MSTRRAQPDAPIVAALAVMVRSGRVLLVQRSNSPDAGRWGFPGGKVERGETMMQAAVRELKEETGVIGRAERVMEPLEALDRAEDGNLLHHYILVPVLCAWLSGEPVAQDDALDARWFDPPHIQDGSISLSQDVSELARKAVEIVSTDDVHLQGTRWYQHPRGAGEGGNI